MALFFTKKKLPQQAIGSFLSPVDFPPNCEVVVEHLRESIRKHTGTQFPLYLFFDAVCAGCSPEPCVWETWKVDEIPPKDLRSYPHLLLFAWVLCDEWQKVVMARNFVIRPEGYTLPAAAGEPYGLNHALALEKGVGLADVLREFCSCLAPATRAVTFDASTEAVALEVALRRAGLVQRFNRNFFYDVSEQVRDYCALPCEDGAKPHAKPTLQDLYEKLFAPFDVNWNEPSADIQILQHCFFPLLKQRVF